MRAICERTRTRTEACSCGTCARRASPDTKYTTNKRDVLALLKFIEGCITSRYVCDSAFDKPTWAHVGDIAYLRGRLMEIAVGLALRPDGDEQAAQRRLEEALCAEDENVAEALIDAV